MNNNISRTLATIAALFTGLLQAPAAAAISFDEVRNFEDVFVISAEAPSRDRIMVRWDIEEDYYLYNVIYFFNH